MKEKKSNPEEGKWSLLLLRYRRWITVGLALLAITTLFLVRYSSNRQRACRSDFLTASHYFSQIEVDGVNHDEALAQLQSIIARREELHAKYDGALAQNLLSHNKSHVAEGYAYSISSRVGDRCPMVAQFTKSTFLISEENYQDALKESISLKLALENEQREDLQTLYAYNLLRIAMLQQEAGTPEAELMAWQELLRQLPADLEEESEGGYRDLVHNFRKGNISLIDYINERIESLVGN
jgi:hypothetical protein